MTARALTERPYNFCSESKYRHYLDRIGSPKKCFTGVKARHGGMSGPPRDIKHLGVGATVA
jgi:hypothetical protein